MLPTIVIDEIKCRAPLECVKCLAACPTRVLNLVNSEPSQKFRVKDPACFKVRGIHLLACSGCMDCVHICPENAIQVTFGDESP